MEEQILYKVIQVLQERTGIKGRWSARADQKNYDGILELVNEKTKYQFHVEFKKEVKTVHLMQFQEIKKEMPDLIVIADIIFPGIREQLRNSGINYIDKAGNCYIRKNEWLFLIEGQRTDTPIATKKDRAFTKTGLTLVFHFLNDASYLNTTYRQMADDYDIALGNIGYIINSLKEQGFVLQTGRKELRLTNTKQLLDEWIAAYDEKLKPSLKIGEFRFLNGNEKEWEKIPLNSYETQWGAEPAAKLLTRYLVPAKLTLYTVENKTTLLKKYKLMPQENGKLEIYKRFWKFESEHQDTAPPVLVYADLVNTGDPRNLETAAKLYDALLKDKF